MSTKMHKCTICGKPFKKNCNRQLVCSIECAKESKRLYDKERYEKAAKRQKYDNLCTDLCPSDCRFREILCNNLYYCNYGYIAFKEGISPVPVRGDVEFGNCHLYEKRTQPRRPNSIYY